ncbi:Cytochrome c oxidase subunit 6 [Blyttiomyces sp. JEL0837]|nr:Cytochrome c oxidase subunit 6 [Blyttiomyces sp. JEL0837]
MISPARFTSLARPLMAVRSIARPSVVRSAALLPRLTLNINQTRLYSDHELDPAKKKDYDAYVQQWLTHFNTVEDDFELERGLNHIFAMDWAPSVEVVAEAIKASRRLNTFATAVRVLEALEHKVHNKGQYEAYLKELKPLLEDLGVVDKHGLGEIKVVRQKVWWADA